MLIFRVENNSRRGPYSTGDMGIISHYTKVKAGLLPEEEVEFAISGYCSSSLNFGCASFDQLLEWFDFRSLRHLFNMGYKIVAIESNVLVQSKTQIGFKRENKVPSLVLCNMEEFRSYYLSTKEEVY